MADDRRLVTFALSRSHPITRGMDGGRVHPQPGETTPAAVARRIARDAGCTLVAVAADWDAAAAGPQGCWRGCITLRPVSRIVGGPEAPAVELAFRAWEHPEVAAT